MRKNGIIQGRRKFIYFHDKCAFSLGKNAYSNSHTCREKGSEFASQQEELCVFRAQLRLRTFYWEES